MLLVTDQTGKFEFFSADQLQTKFSLIGNMYNFEEEKKPTTKSDRKRHFRETVK